MRGDIDCARGRPSGACASSGLVPGAGGDPVSPIGRLRLSLADLRNDIGAVDSGGAQSNAFPSEARQEGRPCHQYEKRRVRKDGPVSPTNVARKLMRRASLDSSQRDSS